jgi:hypothetical protein
VPETEAGDGRTSVRDSRIAGTPEILGAASRTGRMSQGVTLHHIGGPQAGAALGGCLFHFAILMMFLMIFSLMLSLVGGSLFRAFRSYRLRSGGNRNSGFG